MKLIHTWLRAISVDINTIKENFQPTSIDIVITKAVESVEPHAVRKDITLTYEIGADVPMIYGDEGTLVEAIVNIIGNAIKYSPSGSKVDLNAGFTEGQVVIRIEDNGIGISKDDLPYIFEDFYTSSDENKAERGSGVGLALTRRIIEAHEGSITVESELGQGSIFELRLPGFEGQTEEDNPKIIERVNNI